MSQLVKQLEMFDKLLDMFDKLLEMFNKKLSKVKIEQTNLGEQETYL